MKAILVNNPFEVEIKEVPKPEINDEKDVIIKVIAGGICGSDVGIYNGTNSLATYPRIIGHEFGGIVEAVGDMVTKVKVGDLVAVDNVNSCGTCYACRTGHHNVCSTVEVTGVHRDGGFAEYVKTTEANAYKVTGDKINPLHIALVEPYSIGVEVNERGRITKGDKVLVMGSGPIGIAVMQVAKSRGAEVMMTDLVNNRLELATSMGADRVVNVGQENLADAVREFTDGEGIPVVVDSVCIPKSLEEALELVSPAGRIVVLGTGNKPSEIAQVAITKKGADVVGSRLNNYRFPEVIELLESGVLTPEKMHTHTFEFTDVKAALEEVMNNKDEVCKAVLTF
ncbi:zinc-binding alcohol dehydrogenase family protein [Bacillus sp. REN16]|uniref:zinc-binding alcohol dehydrogenase family protein n=1 Tax=Bacillus sp. REN16 TaxID=2887296 RepID=UPI001E50359E|nr:zinc-binding alcohol dehydrogenase family protein [Bacillus sp. REN16]MCC3356147.1 zinc-binding alcohol dehydrogenase family protein [Bacillus sp. REN16]